MIFIQFSLQTTNTDRRHSFWILVHRATLSKVLVTSLSLGQENSTILHISTYRVPLHVCGMKLIPWQDFVLGWSSFYAHNKTLCNDYIPRQFFLNIWKFFIHDSELGKNYVRRKEIAFIEPWWFSGHHQCTTSFSKAWAQILHRFISCLCCVLHLQW